MSQAKIYWDLDNYAQVEKVSDVKLCHDFISRKCMFVKDYC